jgi:hypothetical protein
MFSAGTTTYMLQAYADTLSALFNDGNVALGAAKFGVAGALNVAASKKIYEVTNSIKRDMTFWLRGQFEKAVEADPNILEILREKDFEGDHGKEDHEKQTVHHALVRAPEELSLHLVDTATRGFASVTTAAAMISAIAYNSQPVPYLGDYGTLILAGVVVGGYSTFTYMKGAQLGKKVELAQEAQQKAESRLTENTVKAFDPEAQNGSAVTAEKFGTTFKTDRDKIYEMTQEHDERRQDYAHFMQMTGLGGFFVSPVPALASIPWGEGALSAMTQQAFLATHAQTQFLLNTVTQGIDLFASRGRVTVPAKVISDMAREFIKAKEELVVAKERGCLETESVVIVAKSPNGNNI